MKTMHRQTGNMGQETADRNRISPCDRAAEWESLLYDFAEGLADEEARSAVRRHLRECAYCRGALEDIGVMVSALRTSVPKPRVNLSARVMEAIRAEDDADGCVIAQNIDMQTGRVLSETPQTWNGIIRRAVRAFGGIAAALVLVIGLMYILPFLRAESGAGSPTQEILQGIQKEDSGFSGGVFVGSTPMESDAETELLGFGVIQNSRESAMVDTEMTSSVQSAPYAVLRISGLSADALLRLLSECQTSDGDAISVTETEDGFRISPRSVLDTVRARLRTEYPELGTELLLPDEISASDADDSFYIRISSPQ